MISRIVSTLANYEGGMAPEIEEVTAEGANTAKKVRYVDMQRAHWSITDFWHNVKDIGNSVLLRFYIVVIF